jgi:hypothetical protein
VPGLCGIVDSGCACTDAELLVAITQNLTNSEVNGVLEPHLPNAAVASCLRTRFSIRSLRRVAAADQLLGGTEDRCTRGALTCGALTCGVEAHNPNPNCRPPRTFATHKVLGHPPVPRCVAFIPYPILYQCVFRWALKIRLGHMGEEYSL